MKMVLVALDSRNIHLNLNNAGINPIDGGAESLIEHKDTSGAFTLLLGSATGL
jgi:hypothetical protein